MNNTRLGAVYRTLKTNFTTLKNKQKQDLVRLTLKTNFVLG
jgi:hypothetical protein